MRRLHVLIWGILAIACAGGPVPPSTDPPPSRPDPPPPTPEPTPAPVTPPDSALWPAQPDASWPHTCLIENAEPHPTEPWLALACTAVEPELGAVMVLDASTGSLRSVTRFDTYVGWSEPHLMRWHPDGRRLTSNVGTNGIALLDRARLVGMAFPTRPATPAWSMCGLETGCSPTPAPSSR